MAPIYSKVGNSLDFPFGTKYQILYDSKINGEQKEKQAEICPDPNPNLFYVLFDEEDVDFRIRINNLDCKDREVQTRIKIWGKHEYSYITSEEMDSSLDTLEFRGRKDKYKLHFLEIMQAEAEVAMDAIANGTTYADAAMSMSLMEISVDYSTLQTGTIIQILIQTVSENERKFTIKINNCQTIGALKRKIEQQEGFGSSEQRIIFAGWELDDFFTLEDYSVKNNSLIHLVLKLKLGAENEGESNLADFHDFGSGQEGFRKDPKFPTESFGLIMAMKMKINPQNPTINQ